MQAKYRWRRTIGLCFLGGLGCSGGSSTALDAGGTDLDGGGISIDAGADAGVDARPVDCSSLPTLPITATALTGFSGSEDFAFDSEGNLVSNRDGNITKQPKTGASSLFSPNIGAGTAGTRYLSTGELVIADVEHGELLRIQVNGSTETMLSGIAYPNGVEVDNNDFVYVAEHDAGQIRRVNPTTGAATVIATGLINPNGLSFSPDYKTLYVNSFGGGTVHKITVDTQGNWSSPELLGDVFDTNGDPCAQKEAGDLCTLSTQPGLCVDEEGTLTCSLDGNGPEIFAAACMGVATGEPCSVTVGTTNFTGTCGGGQFGDSFACQPTDNAEMACLGKLEGSRCQAADASYGAYLGKCSSDFGLLHCFADGFGKGGERGGLDGMTVDICGNVYVTEYLVGYIWRFTPEGVREKVAELPSFWIPNMHWGSGVGGWDKKILYVMDREEGRLFELDLGVTEKEGVYPQ